jgi:hypothetical protein
MTETHSSYEQKYEKKNLKKIIAMGNKKRKKDFAQNLKKKVAQFD